MDNSSGRVRIARIKQDDDGNLFVSFRGGFVSKVCRTDPEWATLLDTLKSIETRAVPSEELREIVEAQQVLADAHAVYEAATTDEERDIARNDINIAEIYLSLAKTRRYGVRRQERQERALEAPPL